MLISVTCGIIVTATGSQPAGSRPNPGLGGRLPILGEGGIGAAQADFTGELIPVLERDQIQSLDLPPFIPAGDAASSIAMDEAVLGITVNDVARAYPLRVLSVHEVVNDDLSGIPVVVTFCPLCFSGAVYDRRILGSERTFGVSGFLLNSSLVMFDREQGGLWSQLTGESVGGTGEEFRLRRYPAVQTDWRSWVAAHPRTDVLDVEALGGEARYSVDRFKLYFASNSAGLIPLSVRDDLPEKTLVAGIVIDGVASAYPLEQHHDRIVRDRVGDTAIVVWFDGQSNWVAAYLSPDRPKLDVDVTNPEEPMLRIEGSNQRWRLIDGKSLVGGVDLVPVDVTISFWFAWASFFPETTLWDPIR